MSGHLKRAFFLQYNLILLAGSLLFSLASASPVPLLLGLALELCWLAGSNLGGVRRWLDQRGRIEVRASGIPAPARAVDLDSTYANRARLMEYAASELRELSAKLDAPTRQQVSAGLTAIVRSHAELCAQHQQLSKYLHAAPEASLIEELERLRQLFSAEKDLTLRLAIRQSMTLAQRRIEQRQHLESSLRTAGIRLEMLERAVLTLGSQARALGMHPGLVAELDALLHEAGTDPNEHEPIPRSLVPLSG